MKTYFVMIVIFISIIFSCRTAPIGNFQSYKGQIFDIDSAKIVAHINLIDNSGQSDDQDGAMKTEQNIYKAINDNLKVKFNLNSKELENKPEKFDISVRSLFGALAQNKDTDVIAKLPVLINYMNQYPERYFIFTYDTGFSRTGSNIATSFAGSLLIGILTLGIYIPYAIPSASSLYICIVDKKTLKVIYYKDNYEQEDPRNYEVIKKQVDEILYEFKDL